MSRVIQSLVLAPILAFAVFGAPPATAHLVLPLDPPLRLPEDPDAWAVSSPAVALRPDGGMVTVWSDGTTGEVIGRWFGPADASLEPESGHFTLSAEDSRFGTVALARGDGDRYLAAWQGSSIPYPISARAFDGTGSPLGEAQVVATSAVLSPALAARPSGGFVLTWWERVDGDHVLRYRFLGADGSPLGAVEVVRAPPGANIVSARVAVDPDGAFTIAWSWRLNAESISGLWARTYSSLGEPAGPIVELAYVEQSFQILHDLAAVGAGELLVLWVERPSSGPSTIVRARHFHPDGSAAPVRRVDVPGDAEVRRVSLPALAATPDGHAVAAWVEEVSGGTRVQSRLLESDGIARGYPFTVDSLGDFDDLVNGIDVDRDAAGRLAFAWGVGFEPAVLPIGYEYYRSSFARRFQETDEACHPVLTLDFRTEPSAPAADEPLRLLFDGLADCAQLSVVDWSLDTGPHGGYRVEAFAASQMCLTFPPIPFSLSVDVGEPDAGEQSAVIDVELPGGGSCVREFDFTVAPAEVTPVPPVPDAPPLTSDEIPGFRAWVVITGGGESVLGGKEAACLPETLCVSGRVPGRSEVFVRVVGPKPNGRLWPTLVKLTTSTVEVWLEQVATGEVEYYRLEGARPGFDELPGLFDREGFVP